MTTKTAGATSEVVNIVSIFLFSVAFTLVLGLVALITDLVVLAKIVVEGGSGLWFLGIVEIPVTGFLCVAVVSFLLCGGKIEGSDAVVTVMAVISAVLSGLTVYLCFQTPAVYEVLFTPVAELVFFVVACVLEFKDDSRSPY